MTTSPQGRTMIEAFEGLRLEAYQDQRGIFTIGYGHTAGVKPGDVITQTQADAFLAQDLQHTEAFVSSHVTVPLTQNQFDALVSLTYNIGVGNFLDSTLRRLLNESDYEDAANQFLVWSDVNGVQNAGLLSRRTQERTLFVRAS